jgi:osmotically inducible protein OsmC
MTHPAAEGLHGGASVAWHGDLRCGKGTLRLRLGAGGELPLLWPGAAGYGGGTTSPEELMAAAHAACFTMTLAHVLARAGHEAREIVAEATATFGIAAGARSVRRSQLDVAVDADGLSELELRGAAKLAGRSCPVSNTLGAAGVELDVRTRLAGDAGGGRAS